MATFLASVQPGLPPPCAGFLASFIASVISFGIEFLQATRSQRSRRAGGAWTGGAAGYWGGGRAHVSFDVPGTFADLAVACHGSSSVCNARGRFSTAHWLPCGEAAHPVRRRAHAHGGGAALNLEAGHGRPARRHGGGAQEEHELHRETRAPRNEAERRLPDLGDRLLRIITAPMIGPN